MFSFCSIGRSRISQGRPCQTSISSELKSNTCAAKSCGTGKRFRISSARALQPSPPMSWLVRMQAKVDGLCEERDRLVVISAESTPEQIKSLTAYRAALPLST